MSPVLTCPVTIAGDRVHRYVAGTLEPGTLAEFETHLLGCAECQAAVREGVAVRAALRDKATAPGLERRDWRRWWPIPTGIAAAAAILLLVLRPPGVKSPATGPIVRGPGEMTVTLEAISPLDGAVTVKDSVVFTWRSLGTEVSYRLTLTDERGDLIWSVGTTDTMVLLPSSAKLLSGRTNIWYVDALLADGRSATTGARRFRIGS